MYYILFLVNPLWAFLKAMKNLLNRNALIIFILFYGLYGYAISFELTSSDSYRIGARFCQTDFSWWLVWQMYQEGALTDIYLIFVFSVLKLFTDNPKILYGILGLVMGTFAGLSIRQLYTVWKGKHNKYFYLIVLFYFLSISFFNLQTTRFFTATSIFSYFVIQYLYLGQKKALIGTFITPLFHFGYLAAVFALIVYVFGVRWFSSTKLCYWIMAMAFAMNFAMPQSAVNDIMGSEEEAETFSSSYAINKKYKTYSKSTDKVSEASYHEEVSTYRQANRAFTTTCNIINKIGMFLLLTTFYRRRKHIIQTATQKHFFNYVLYSYAVGYIAGLLFNSGARFIVLANMLSTFWLLTIFQNNNNYIIRRYCKLLIPINFYSISFFFFNVARMVTPLFWYAPPIFTIIDGIGFEPIDFIY